MKEFQELLDAAAALHGHLCSGQVLGVRMAQAGLNALGGSTPKLLALLRSQAVQRDGQVTWPNLVHLVRGIAATPGVTDVSLTTNGMLLAGMARTLAVR